MNTIPIILLAVSMGFSAAQPLQLEEEDFGQTVDIHVGEFFELVLGGNPTTGYNWTVVSVDDGILRQVGETKFQPKTNARGSGGLMTMRFEAVGSGKTCLKLIYHRSFEKTKPPIKTFEVFFDVK